MNVLKIIWFDLKDKFYFDVTFTRSSTEGLITSEYGSLKAIQLLSETFVDVINNSIKNISD